MAKVEFQDIPDAQKHFLERCADAITANLERDCDEFCRTTGVPRALLDNEIGS